MKRFMIGMAMGLTVVGLLAGCGRQSAALVTVAGSTAFQPFAEKLAEQFMAMRNDVNITVQGGGSALGIQAARSGTAQIGMADLVQLPPEAAELVSTTVARDGLALIVHPANGVTNLSIEQVRGLFNGTLKNWKEAGGADQSVRVVSREAGSGTRSSFEQTVGGIRLTAEAIIQDSNGTIRETVANDPNTIGYLTHGLLSEKVRAVRVDGVDCTEAAILEGRYKLVRPVFLLTKGAPGGAAKDFIDYVLSPEGQGMIRSYGLLPAK
ncbi:MAG: phosphate ABC transporter substrate-binding protein [Lentisphaerae bacterium]|nr:phosphate ABC transporter substrate-binding protein [Lentisphaerota bacterium]